MYRFIDGVIEMKDNIVYLRSAATKFSGLPEADHIYEELPGSSAPLRMSRKTSMAVLKKKQLFENSHRCLSSILKGAEEQPTDDKSLQDEDVTTLMMTCFLKSTE